MSSGTETNCIKQRETSGKYEFHGECKVYNLKIYCPLMLQEARGSTLLVQKTKSPVPK